jgi:uncharacterized phage protein gp47/JayE
MKVLNTKSLEELTKESISDLEAVGFSTSNGSIAKLFLNIINKYLSEFYNVLTINHLRAFVTTSDGDGLDAIGALLQCTRLDGESDDNYRYRITNQCLVLATSNETAIRLAALTTEGVEDCIVKEYAMGSGSFAVIIITNEQDTNSVIESVKEKLQNVHAYGIRYTVEVPKLTYIKIKHSISISDRVSDTEKQEIRYDVQLALSDYFNNLSIGQNINTDKITQIILNTNENIIQESNIDLYINNQKAIYNNQTCRWFEKFALSPDIDNVVII